MPPPNRFCVRFLLDGKTTQKISELSTTKQVCSKAETATESDLINTTAMQICSKTANALSYKSKNTRKICHLKAKTRPKIYKTAKKGTPKQASRTTIRGKSSVKTKEAKKKKDQNQPKTRKTRTRTVRFDNSQDKLPNNKESMRQKHKTKLASIKTQEKYHKKKNQNSSKARQSVQIISCKNSINERISFLIAKTNEKCVRV